MNKKLLLLAGILALGATTFAAEGTREGTRGFLDTFRDVMSPKEDITGFWNQEFKAYTDSESEDDKIMKLNNVIGLNLTDKLSMALETNTYMNYPGKNYSSSDNFSVEANYNNGTIGDTDLNLSQRVKMYRSDNGAENYSYRPLIEFSSYIGADSAEASIEYTYKRDTAADDAQQFAYDLYASWTLGYGFGTEVEIYGTITTSDGRATESALYLGLYYDYNLYTAADEATTLAFHADVSATPVTYNHEVDEMHSAKEMYVDTGAYLKLKHSLTNSFSTYVKAGVSTSDDTKNHTSNVSAQGYLALGLSYSM
jgi:hypothetical protein